MIHSFATGDRVKAMPDYSTLPAEILQMIMKAVAGLSQTERRFERTISPHLFKCRFISKTMCMAATTVFTKLAQQTRHAQYQVLHLPPGSGDLATLIKALSGPHTMYGNLITSIVYHISSGQDREIDPDMADGYFCDCDHDEDDEDDSASGFPFDGRTCCGLSRKLPGNIDTYRRQCLRQDKFADHVHKSHDLLRILLTSLPVLAGLEIEVKDFWHTIPEIFLSSADEHKTPARKAFYVIPVLLELISASPASMIKLDGFGTYAFGALNPIRIFQLSKQKTFLRNITDLTLDLSHRDELFWDDGCEEIRFANIQRADRVSFLLHRLKKLQTLSLSCKEACGVKGGVEKDPVSDRWLREVLERQRWPLLRSFSLQGFSYAHDNKELPAFLERHKSTLVGLVLRDINYFCQSDHDAVVDLLKIMRDKLRVSTASITINKMVHLSSELEIMLDHDETCRESLVSPLWEVDIGALVLKPQKNKMVELE